MSIRPGSGIFCLGCFLLVSSACFGAKIEPVQGSFYLNQGQGFQPVNGPVEAKIGDAIMVSPGAMAVVLYPDGCKVSVQPGAVTTITSASPCTNPFGPNAQNPNPTYAQEAPPNYTMAVVGAAVLGAAGLGVGIYALSKKNDTTTINTGFTCGSISNPCFTSVSP